MSFDNCNGCLILHFYILMIFTEQQIVFLAYNGHQYNEQHVGPELL